MLYKSSVPDRVLLQTVTNKIAMRGIRLPCKIDVAVKNGDVTLSGTVQYAHQKGSAEQAIKGITGVRRVDNKLTVKPIARH